MKRIRLMTILLLLACSGRAEAPAHPGGPEGNRAAGMEISGFRVPDYDDDGQLRAEIFGEHAKVLPGGEVAIKNLKIDVYKEGRVEMTLFAPECRFDMQTRNARSEGEVLVRGDTVTMTGRGFAWYSKAGHFEIFHDARIIAKGGDKKAWKEAAW